MLKLSFLLIFLTFVASCEQKIGSESSKSLIGNSSEGKSSESLVFRSCFEIFNHYSGAVESGTYEIDQDLDGALEPFDVHCEMDENSGGWTRVLVHDVNSGFFSSKVDATEKNITDPAADLYSILSKLENFKRDDKFEFWLNYNEVDGASGGNIWTQSSNPVTSSVSDYIAISIDHTGSFWGGLEKSSNPGTLLDGSVNHGNWWYAVGGTTAYGSATTVPGPSIVVSEIILYVR